MFDLHGGSSARETRDTSAQFLTCTVAAVPEKHVTPAHNASASGVLELWRDREGGKKVEWASLLAATAAARLMFALAA